MNIRNTAHKYGLKYGNRHLPNSEQDEIQCLYTVTSLENFRDKINEVKALVKKYGH